MSFWHAPSIVLGRFSEYVQCSPEMGTFSILQFAMHIFHFSIFYESLICTSSTTITHNQLQYGALLYSKCRSLQIAHIYYITLRHLFSRSFFARPSHAKPSKPVLHEKCAILHHRISSCSAFILLLFSMFKK